MVKSYSFCIDSRFQAFFWQRLQFFPSFVNVSFFFHWLTRLTGEWFVLIPAPSVWDWGTENGEQIQLLENPDLLPNSLQTYRLTELFLRFPCSTLEIFVFFSVYSHNPASSTVCCLFPWCNLPALVSASECNTSCLYLVVFVFFQKWEFYPHMQILQRHLLRVYISLM